MRSKSNEWRKDGKAKTKEVMQVVEQQVMLHLKKSSRKTNVLERNLRKVFKNSQLNHGIKVEDINKRSTFNK